MDEAYYLEIKKILRKNPEDFTLDDVVICAFKKVNFLKTNLIRLRKTIVKNALSSKKLHENEVIRFDPSISFNLYIADSII